MKTPLCAYVLMHVSMKSLIKHAVPTRPRREQKLHLR